jgi:hypothetical protein
MQMTALSGLLLVDPLFLANATNGTAKSDSHI